MTDEEYQDWKDMIRRGRALLDDWEELRAIGPEAEKYC
jgi:hypothetical protein